MKHMKEQILSWTSRFTRIPVLGLDISDRTAKYLKFSSLHKRPVIDFFGEFDIPEGLIVNGEVKQEDELVGVFRSWVSRERKRLKGCFAVIALPEEKSFVRFIQIPRVKEDDIPHAVQWELENQIPLPVSEAIFDYEIVELQGVGPPRDHFDVQIIAFPKEVIYSYLRPLKRAGIRPFVLELESQAIARACATRAMHSSAKILADIGRTRSSIIVFVGGSMFYTTTIHLGGILFEEHIAKVFRVAPEEAGRIKKEVGLDKKYAEGKVLLALAPVLGALSDELKRIIEYYESHSTHVHGASSSIDGILISGGDGNLIGLDTYLAGRLRIPVERADPFAALRANGNFQIPVIPHAQALAFTTAIGLALRAN